MSSFEHRVEPAQPGHGVSTVAIIGCGTVGNRAAQQLLTMPSVDRVLLFDRDPAIAARVAALNSPKMQPGLGDPLECGAQVVLLASPPTHAEIARQFLEAGSHVVSTSDSLSDTEQLLALESVAVRVGRRLVIGAGFAPGLTDVLALHASREFDEVHEVHAAKHGTAGPACARQHHLALKGAARDWRDGKWVSPPGGSGRELCWFPDPIGGADCYRAALPDSLLLHRLFPDAIRLTGRMWANRRDRFTAPFPMLREPHAEAGDGAVRVEVRGSRNGVEESIVFACKARPSVATGSVAAITIATLLAGTTPGVGGLGECVDPVAFLSELSRRGVACSRFIGTDER
jgi:saccharopine dehydrogenase-like NADP-dependent oxidoreductase